MVESLTLYSNWGDSCDHTICDIVKRITARTKKESLICKYCFQIGALETNLELNQEFIDEYNKNLEAKKNISEISKDIIKETSEENISDKEDSTHKLEEEGENNDLNLSNNIIKNEIKCLTFDCHNYPYYICETCKDFICYKCIMEKLEERTDKIKHNFHDIDSVNYEANTFRDDVKINLYSGLFTVCYRKYFKNHL